MSNLHFRFGVTALVLGCLGACTGAGANEDTAETSSTSVDDSGSSSGNDGSSSGDGDPSCTPELEALRDEIFTPSCALPTCHGSADAAAGLNLEAADLEAELVGQPSGTCDGWIRVVPGAPDESLLYAKVAGTPPCGSVMPPPDGLPAEQAACLRTWIENLDGMNCETCGGDACVDLDTDTQHCGQCDNACPAGVSCTNGACSCPAGQALCDGACVDVQADPQNCGGCGGACPPDKVCWMGVCADTCADLTDCAGGCVDTQTNPEHCGSCDNACQQGNACEMGGCGCPGDGVSFVAEVEPLLVDNCTSMGCHGFPAPSAGLDLRAGSAYADLVNVPSSQCGERMRVAPGQPGSSYLVDKLQGTDLCFGTGMPKAAPPLSADEIATISEWICRGAIDN